MCYCSFWRTLQWDSAASSFSPAWSVTLLSVRLQKKFIKENSLNEIKFIKKTEQC